MKKPFHQMLALMLALVMVISLGASTSAAEIITDQAESVSEVQAEDESVEIAGDMESVNDSDSNNTQNQLEETTNESPETESIPPLITSSPENDVDISAGKKSEFSTSPLQSLSFDEDSYTGPVGEVLNITANFKGVQAPTDYSWECFTRLGSKRVKNAISFSSTSVLGPAETGEENTWWISVAATLVKEGSYTVVLSGKTGSIVTYTASVDVTVTKAVTSRYTVLILDASGSMSGTPEQVQKEAAIKFCQAVTSASADDHIAIVSMDSYANVSCDFTTELDTLTNCIQNISASGWTDMTGALSTAQSLLSSIESSQGIIKNIVLCSDGEPDSVSSAKSTASEIKNGEITVYTLGFFHNLSGSSLESARQLMIEIASSEECYYEVTSVDQLEFYFLGIATDITVEPVSIETAYATYLPLTDGIIQYQITAHITNNSKTTDLTNLFVQLDEGDSAEIITEYGEWSQHADALAKGSSTEFTWVISINAAQVYPDGGAHPFIVYAGSDQTVTSSSQGSIAVDANNGESNELDFSKDVWNFHNPTHKEFHEDVMVEDDKNALLAGYSPSNRAILIELLKRGADEGHCFGMSLSTILGKMNIFDVSRYTAATCLREAEKTDRIMSILCYYQILQNLDSFTSDVQTFKQKSMQERLSLLETRAHEVKAGGAPVLLSLEVNSNEEDKCFSHAVVAYATESGRWEYDGITYNKRILIYDCNAANEYAALDSFANPFKNPNPTNPIWDENHCLYFNEGTDQWVVPAYIEKGVCSTNQNAGIKRACNDLDILNILNYDSQRYNYIAELRAQNETAMRMENSENVYTIKGKSGSVTGDTDLMTYYDCEYNEEENQTGDLHVVLPDENDRYTLSTLSGKTEELDFYISDEDLFLSVEAAAAKGSTFSIDDGITLLENTGSYELKIADDNVDEGSYNTYTVSGDNDGNTSIEVVDDGIQISGDNLTNITVIGSDTVNESEIVFSTDEDKVLVVADEDNSKLIVLADKDNDNEYESIISDDETEDAENDNDKKGESSNSSTVIVPSTTNGSITITPSNPQTGDTVTVQVTPDKGYELENLSVTDDKGRSLTLICNKDGTYNFTMPSGNVTISAKFKPSKPAEPSKSSDSGDNNTSKERKIFTSVTSPNTGDNTNIEIWMFVLLISGIGLVLLIAVQKRNRSNNS